MTDVRKAVIIGSGIAGPVTAMALRNAGIEATVYEAYATTADGLGGQLTVAPNGLAALEIIGAADAVRAVGQPIDRTVMADGAGRAIGEFPGSPDWHRARHCGGPISTGRCTEKRPIGVSRSSSARNLSGSMRPDEGSPSASQMGQRRSATWWSVRMGSTRPSEHSSIRTLRDRSMFRC
jgi:hypothetical protein